MSKKEPIGKTEYTGAYDDGLKQKIKQMFALKSKVK